MEKARKKDLFTEGVILGAGVTLSALVVSQVYGFLAGVAYDFSSKSKPPKAGKKTGKKRTNK